MFYGLLPTYILIGALFAPGGAIVNPGQSSLLEIPPFAAVIPSAFNADNKTDAAFLSDSLASVKTPTDSPMNDPLPTAVEINRFNPAARNGFSIKERKCVISGLSPICRMSMEIPAYGLSLLDKPVICSGVIDRGANFSSIFTLANRSPSAILFASAARAFASADAALASSALELAPAKLDSACFAAARDCEASAFASSARALVSARSRLKYSSFTFPIQTTRAVAITPIAKAPIRDTLATSYSRTAVSNEGHMRFLTILPWLCISLIGIASLTGLIFIVGFFRHSRRVKLVVSNIRFHPRGVLSAFEWKPLFAFFSTAINQPIPKNEFVEMCHKVAIPILKASELGLMVTYSEMLINSATAYVIENRERPARSAQKKNP